MQQSASRPSKMAAPTIDPTTIPAICPPVRLSFEPLVPAAVVFEEPLEFEFGNSGGMVASGGKSTPTHLLVTFEPTQHESVALGELVAQ